MRGKGSIYGDTLKGAGITPAYAGKSVIHELFQPFLRDHPRVCGEKRVVTSATGTGTGSPPRMRGKENAPIMQGLNLRITPAYAGKRIQTLVNLTC